MDHRIKAGREYLKALNRLGFRPDALFWALRGDQANAPMELCIVTSWADNIGSKSVYDLLFEAYDISATPKEIDPFIVTLLSPQTTVAHDLSGAVRMIHEPGYNHDPKGAMIILGMLDYMTMAPWILHYRQTRSARFDDARTFSAFRANVERLAA